MSVTVSNQVENHRAVSFQFTGDGSTTSIVVAHGRYKAPLGTRTAQAYLVTAPTTKTTRSGRGGVLAPTDGTNVALNSVTEDSAGNVTIVTTAAVTNAVVCYGTIVFDQNIS